MSFLSINTLLAITVGLSIAACKTRSDGTEHMSSPSGIISQSPPGGTLAKRELESFDCQGFHEAVWYRMSKPVGAMIWHQYLGLRITFSTKDGLQHEFETSGLSDPSDLGNFKSWWSARGESNKFAHMISSKKYQDCAQFLASARRINKAMAESRYQSVGIRVLSMIIAPVPVLGGRPCARAASTGESVWLVSNQQGNEQTESSCDDCTVEFPGAKWTTNSVDWDETAFRDAADSGGK